MILDGKYLTDTERLRLHLEMEHEPDVPETPSALSPQPSGNAITKVSAHTALDQNDGGLTSEWRKQILAEC